MPFRIAFGSCSNPQLEQPLWKIIRAREPVAFIWGGDSVYSDQFVGLNWTAVGIHRIVEKDFHNPRNHNSKRNDSKIGWKFAFPPPSIHVDATPEMMRFWYEEQWAIDDYRRFVEGWSTSSGEIMLSHRVRPIIFGVIDDHDYGQNNGDSTYKYKMESNVAFLDFLYSGTDREDSNECRVDFNDDNDRGACEKKKEERTRHREKTNDPMYQRAVLGKGVYGVQLFDFSKEISSLSSLRKDQVLIGGGYWVSDEDAKIDPDAIVGDGINNYTPTYSATHSVAIFALDVRTNKTPWPKDKRTQHTQYTSSSDNEVPTFDFLGEDQWIWLRSALNNSRAAVNIIVSGLQIHPERFPNDGNIIEEWSKFPESRQMLYNTILDSGVKSPLLVSGDVHMAQILRKDCIKSSDIVKEKRQLPQLGKKPLLEITTSGMTHSWGTCFSSQPKNHRFPLKLYSYFVSRMFMTICHYICPWLDIVVQTVDDTDGKLNSRVTAMNGRKSSNGVHESLLGKQYFLGLNFAEFEFDFEDQTHEGSDGSVTVRIFGREPNAPPKLELTYTFEELSGNVDLPGMSAKFPNDFVTVREQIGRTRSSNIRDDWICVPHRGLASIYHEHAADIGMFLSFCFLFFLPHGLIVCFIALMYKKWAHRKNRLKKVH